MNKYMYASGYDCFCSKAFDRCRLHLAACDRNACLRRCPRVSALGFVISGESCVFITAYSEEGIHHLDNVSRLPVYICIYRHIAIVHPLL